MCNNSRRTAVLVALSLCLVPVIGQADDLQADLEKLLKDGTARLAKVLGEKVEGVLAEAQKGFVEAVGEVAAKHVAAAEARLKKEIAARDEKISGLEARLKRLERDLASAQKKEDDWPATNLSRAYLAVGHTDGPDGDGALIVNVIADGPAAAAGLKPGDVIINLNGKAVSSENLQTAIQTFKPGAKVKLAYLRGGKRAEAEVSLVDNEEFWARRTAKLQPVVLGVLISEQGLTVTEVEDGFTGSIAGLKVDDRLTKVNGVAVTTFEEIGAALGKVRSGDRLDLGVQRGDETLTLSVIGSHEKGKAKLVASTVAKKPAKKEDKKPVVVKPEKKPAKKEEKKAVVVKPEKKPAYLGIDVIDAADGPAVIAAVLPDTTASAFGLKEGDIVKKLNGADVATTKALISAVKKLSPGDKISLVVSRGGQDIEISDALVGAPGQKIAAPKKPGSVGIVAEQTEDGKVLVKTLVEGGAAGGAGLKPGDVILEANGKAIKSFDDLAEVVSGLHAGDVVSFKIRRGDKEDDVKVTLAATAN